MRCIALKQSFWIIDGIPDALAPINVAAAGPRPRPTSVASKIDTPLARLL
jgi:hypothetical protein